MISPQDVAEDLKPIVDLIIAEKAKGFSPFSYPVIFSVISPLMKIAQRFKNASGEQKKQFVIDAGIWVYKTFDPDLPLVSGRTEESIEHFMLKNVWPSAIEFAVSFWKEEKK